MTWQGELRQDGRGSFQRLRDPTGQGRADYVQTSLNETRELDEAEQMMIAD